MYLRFILLFTFILPIALAKAQEPDSTKGRRLYNEGLGAFGKDNEELRTKLMEATNYLKVNGPWIPYVDAYNGLYFYYKELNFQFDSAQKYAELAYQTAQEKLPPSHNIFATAVNGKGVLLVQMGAYEEAKRHFEYMVENEIFDKEKKDQYLANLYNSLGACHKELGDYDEAQRYYEQALFILQNRASSNAFSIANQHNQIAKLNSEIGKFELAKIHYNLALGLLSPNNKTHLKWVIDYHQSLAIIANKLKQEEDVPRLMRKVKELQNIHPYFLFTNAKIFADYYLQKQDYEQAIFEQNRHVISLDSIFKDRARHPNLVAGIRHQGEIHQQFGYYEKALERYQFGISILSKGIDPSDYSQNPSLEDAQSSFDLLSLLSHKAHTLKNWGTQLQHTPHLESALASYNLLMKMVAEVRANYRSAKSQSAISEINTESIENGLDLCFQMSQEKNEPIYLDYALAFMEQNKASILQSSLRELEARESLGLPDSILGLESQISNSLADIRTMLYREQNQRKGRENVISSFKQDLFEVEEKQRIFIQRLERDYPEYYNLKYELKEVKLSSIQGKLSKGEVVIEYFWGKEHIYMLGISQEKTFLTRVSQSADIKSTLLAFWDRLKNGKLAMQKGFDAAYFQEFTSEAHQLYISLLEPILGAFSGNEKLILIPDGLLNYLSFEALLSKPSPKSAKIDYAGLPYVIKDYPINYQYSAALFTQRDQKKKTEAEHILLSVAPEYQSGEKYSIDIEKLLSSNDTREGVNPLVYNQEEVSFISKIWDGLALLGKEATETAFKSLSPKAKILHLAMHAFSDDNDPMHSGLIFNPATEDDLNDGILYAHEIYDMDIQAELVILSACNTGAGQLSEGEGVMSLARSFAYAGCPSTAMSLWQANDETISQIMKSFHTYLNEGLQKSDAMRQAKLDFLESSDRTHPYFWAAFMTIGDDSPISGSGWPVWTYMLIGLLLLALIFFLRKRKQN